MSVQLASFPGSLLKTQGKKEPGNIHNLEHHHKLTMQDTSISLCYVMNKLLHTILVLQSLNVVKASAGLLSCVYFLLRNSEL